LEHHLGWIEADNDIAPRIVFIGRKRERLASHILKCGTSAVHCDLVIRRDRVWRYEVYRCLVNETILSNLRAHDYDEAAGICGERIDPPAAPKLVQYRLSFPLSQARASITPTAVSLSEAWTSIRRLRRICGSTKDTS